MKIHELNVQEANDTNTNSGREEIQTKINQLIDELNRIENNIEFNTRPLFLRFRGRRKSRATLQIGANAGQMMTITIVDIHVKDLGLSNNPNDPNYLDVSSHEKATASLEWLGKAIEKVSSERSSLGANQNRLEYTINY